jgi:hypothetical protein
VEYDITENEALWNEYLTISRSSLSPKNIYTYKQFSWEPNKIMLCYEMQQQEIRLIRLLY